MKVITVPISDVVNKVINKSEREVESTCSWQKARENKYPDQARENMYGKRVTTCHRLKARDKSRKAKLVRDCIRHKLCPNWLQRLAQVL